MRSPSVTPFLLLLFSALATLAIPYNGTHGIEFVESISEETIHAGSYLIFSFMAFAMMSVFSQAFVSCGDDDPEDEITAYENGTYRTKNETGTWKKSGYTLMMKSDILDEDLVTYSEMTIKKFTTKEMSADSCLVDFG